VSIVVNHENVFQQTEIDECRRNITLLRKAVEATRKLAKEGSA